MTTTDCPCGSGETYVACCGPLHRGDAIATTALQLMRARYSAFAVGDAAFLSETWLPATRPASIELEAAAQWRRLHIRAVTAGGEDDDVGTVDFVAHYWDSVNREYRRQEENSRFVREDGRWLYVEPAP